MSEEGIIVISPAGRQSLPRRGKNAIAPRAAGLKGANVAIISSGGHDSRPAMDIFSRELQESLGLGDILRFDKLTTTALLNKDQLAHIVKDAKIAIIGLGS